MTIRSSKRPNIIKQTGILKRKKVFRHVYDVIPVYALII